MGQARASAWVCAAALAVGVGLVGGCQQNQGPSSAPRTPGEKTEMQGKMIADAGAMRQKGEQMMVEGNGKRGQGQQLIAQGKVDEGKTMAAEGEAQIRQGQEMIRQAEEMKMRAMNMPVTTRPSSPDGGGVIGNTTQPSSSGGGH